MPRKHTQRSDRHMPSQKPSLAPHREKWIKSRPTPHQTSRPTRSHVKHETEFRFDDDGADDDGSETEGSIFGWEEEATLLSDLMEEESPQSEDHQYDALVESLQDPFSNESKRLKAEIASTFVPAHNRVKAVYKTLDQRIDTAYGQGVVQFNKACTEIEAAMSLEQTEFRTAYQATKKNIDVLFERLRLEYAVRDQLWVDVRKAVDEIVAPAIERLKDTPASIERTIVKLEKKSESLEKHKDKDKDISSLTKELWKKLI